MERTELTRPALRRYALVAGLSLLVLSVLAGLANFGGIEALVTETTRPRRHGTSWPRRAGSGWRSLP